MEFWNNYNRQLLIPYFVFVFLCPSSSLGPLLTHTFLRLCGFVFSAKTLFLDNLIDCHSFNIHLQENN